VSDPADIVQEGPPVWDRSTAQASSSLLSRWGLSVGLALLGLVDSSYLTWIKLANAAYTCSNIGDCEAVNNSSFAAVGGIPIAALGAAAYAVILLLLMLDRRRSELLRFGVFGLSLAGTLYSAYLTYVQVAILKAICPFCTASAVILTALLVLSILRLPAPEG